MIEVETPGSGDDTRSRGPPFVGPEDDPISTYFLSCNRNKESITLDLKSEDGVQPLARLATHADVLLENFRPGVMGRLGLSVRRLHELNPRRVVLSITGFGHDGPEGGRLGYDQIAQGEAGLMPPTGPGRDHSTRVGVPIGDVLAGCMAPTARSRPCTNDMPRVREGGAHKPAGRDRRGSRVPGHPAYGGRRGAASAGPLPLRPGRPQRLARFARWTVATTGSRPGRKGWSSRLTTLSQG